MTSPIQADLDKLAFFFTCLFKREKLTFWDQLGVEPKTFCTCSNLNTHAASYTHVANYTCSHLNTHAANYTQPTTHAATWIHMQPTIHSQLHMQQHEYTHAANYTCSQLHMQPPEYTACSQLHMQQPEYTHAANYTCSQLHMQPTTHAATWIHCMQPTTHAANYTCSQLLMQQREYTHAANYSCSNVNIHMQPTTHAATWIYTCSQLATQLALIQKEVNMCTCTTWCACTMHGPHAHKMVMQSNSCTINFAHTQTCWKMDSTTVTLLFAACWRK